MVKAEEKKNNNISEYIIYMFQTEDLVRALKVDLNQITEYVIASLPISDKEKKELILWYASIIENMKSQQIEKEGHLKEVNDLMAYLHTLHTQLISTEDDYKKIALKAEPYIQQQIKESKNTLSNPIQICLNAIYGFLLLKLDGKEVNSDQQKMLDAFGDLLSYLSFKFKSKDD